MKKKVWITLLTAGAAVLVSLGIWLFCTANMPTKLDMTVAPITQVNYNNYNAFSRLDYKGGELAWHSDSLFVSKLNILDNGGNTTTLTGITAPFQLAGERIVYAKDNALRYRDLSNGEDAPLADDVSHFLAVEDGVLYLSGNTLYQHFWNGEHTTLGYGIVEFYYHNNTVYAFTEDSWLVEPITADNWREIYDFKNDPFEFPPNLKFQENCAIHVYFNELRYISLTDGSMKTIPIAEGTDVDSKIIVICDEEHLFLSFQAVSYNGSIVSEIEDVHNGIWRVDSKTGQQEKLCDQSFQQLYLFEGERLFGVTDDALYQIDTRNGHITQIAE